MKTVKYKFHNCNDNVEKSINLDTLSLAKGHKFTHELVSDGEVSDGDGIYWIEKEHPEDAIIQSATFDAADGSYYKGTIVYYADDNDVTVEQIGEDEFRFTWYGLSLAEIQDLEELQSNDEEGENRS